MKPSSFSWPLNANSTASQRKVTSVSPCRLMSFGVRTLVTSSAPSPAKATAVTFSFRGAARIQPVTMSAKITATIHSSRDSGPILRSASRAAAGASVVLAAPGGNTLYRMKGSRRIIVSTGTDEASSHEPKLIFTP